MRLVLFLKRAALGGGFQATQPRAFGIEQPRDLHGRILVLQQR